MGDQFPEKLVETADVTLVSMPWTNVLAPSIQIGILKAVLEAHEIRTQNFHFYVDFFDTISAALGGKKLSIGKFESFGHLFGEWAFSVPPFRTNSPENDAAFRALVTRGRVDIFREVTATGSLEAWLDVAFRVRSIVPKFLEKCATEILQRKPKVVGFSTAFSQNIPSLVLSKILKERCPELRIVFGGANCEGAMGEGLLRLFPWIDVVARGEGELTVPILFRELLDGQRVTRQAGLCIREGSEVEICGHGVNEPVKLTRFGGTVTKSEVKMDDVPLPIYNDYFDRIAKTSLREADIWLPYEAARGCWWGAVSLCTFCAAVSENWSFRAKSPRHVLADLKELAQRHGKRSIWFVDNIMDERYFSEVFPSLKDDPIPMFVEMRAHTTKEALKNMRDAGVVMVQPGIESLSTTILGLMKKGTNAIQAVRTIKWCAEMGVSAFYNFIYGFPKEPEAEYQRMADTVLSLTHLQPPNAPYRLRLDRFGVYYRDPEASGITILGPSPFRQAIYGLPAEQLHLIEPSMVFSYNDGRNPDDYVKDLATNCALWRDQWHNNFRKLSWHYKGSGIQIYDTRSNTDDKVYELDEIETIAYLTCDAGATPAMVLESLPAEKRASYSVEQVRRLLVEMTDLRLMFADGARFLSLAVEGDDRLLEAHKQKGSLTFQPLRIPSSSECQMEEALA